MYRIYALVKITLVTPHRDIHDRPFLGKMTNPINLDTEKARMRLSKTLIQSVAGCVALCFDGCFVKCFLHGPSVIIQL